MIYIIGSNSKIVQEFRKRFFNLDVNYVGRSGSFDFYLDLHHVNDFDFSMIKSRDKVVFAAGITSPNECANDLSASNWINVDSSSIFINKCLARGADVLFLSSDVVFEGAVAGKNDEECPKFPLNEYALQKSILESKFLWHPNFYVLRLSYVVGAFDGFMKYLMECSQSKETAEVFSDFKRSVVCVSDVVECLFKFCAWESTKKFPKLLHVCGPRNISRSDMASVVSRYIALSFSAVPAPQSFYGSRVPCIKFTSCYLTQILGREPKSFDIFCRDFFNGM